LYDIAKLESFFACVCFKYLCLTKESPFTIVCISFTAKALTLLYSFRKHAKVNCFVGLLGTM